MSDPRDPSGCSSTDRTSLGFISSRGLGPDDFAEVGRLCAPHDKASRESGDLDEVGSLGTPDQSRTIVVEGGEVSTRAGPYAETSEPFGAFFIVEAESIEEAVETARLHPGVNIGDRFGRGGIEIRPTEWLERC